MLYPEKLHNTITILGLALATGAWFQTPDRTLVYSETTRGTESATVWYDCFVSADGSTRIKGQSSNSTFEATLGTSSETVRWIETPSGKGKSIELRRKGSSFDLITGDSSTEIDVPAEPWYQMLVQLSTFAAGPHAETRFCSYMSRMDERLKSGDMTVFTAKKIGKQRIPRGTGTTDAWKVRVTFADYRSMFWGAWYWYAVDDGTLLRYEEVRGGPGTPTTVGTLVEDTGR